MKKLLTITALAAVMAMAGCSRDQQPQGSLSFSVQALDQVADASRSQLSSYVTLPSTADFILAITDDSGASVWEGKLSQWNSSTALPAGNYKVKATYGSPDEEGFDKPAFEGEKGFAIQGGQQTSVAITVKLVNCLVRTEFTTAFKNYFKDYSFTVSTAAGTNISFPRTETRAAFMDAYRFTISGSMTNQYGASLTFPAKQYSDLEAATCYTVKFDAASTGGLTVQISFNDTVETVDLGEVELN